MSIKFVLIFNNDYKDKFQNDLKITFWIVIFSSATNKKYIELLHCGWVNFVLDIEIKEALISRMQ
jgi:hypothetical protein